MKFADRLKESSTVTDTTTVDLTGAVSGYNSLAKAVSSGALTVGDAGICFVVEDTNGNWEEGLYTITSTTRLTRQSILASSNNNAAVAFPAGTKSVYCTVPASFLSKAITTDDSVSLTSLTSAPASGIDSYVAHIVDPATGTSYKITVSALRTSGGSTDTTNPTAPTGLATSNVTATSATLTWSAGTDNVAVASYQVSTNGSSWTNVGNVLTYNFTGLTASTTYTLYVQTVDSSGNKSPSATIGLTTGSSSDTTAPVMSGSVTSSNVTSSGLTMAYSAGTDNVGIVRYDVSVDTGTANWVQNGTNLSYNASGLSASTGYTLRVRAADAAGNLSNVLTGTATTSAAGPVFHFNGNYSTFQSTATYGANSYASFAESIYIMDASNNGINFATYDVYLVVHNSATVAPTNTDALHNTHSNTYNLATNPGNTPGLASGNSIFVYKDTFPAGTYYLWAVVVAKGAGQTGTVVWAKAYDGANTGTPVALTVAN